jgi:hypothetical protein
MRDEILVKAGIAAAKKWNIDPTKVNVMFVSGLDSFKVNKSSLLPASEEIAHSRPPSDDMVFENNYGTRWRENDVEFWLAWGAVTNTLAICIKWGESVGDHRCTAVAADEAKELWEKVKV